MASSLPLQHVLTLRVHMDPGTTAPSKAIWLDSFSHAVWTTDLRIDNALVPALASALGKQTLYERNVEKQLFPRLVHVMLSKVKTRDVELLHRAMQRRAPGQQMVLGRFIIDAEVVKRKSSHPPIAFIKRDGTRVPVCQGPSRVSFPAVFNPFIYKPLTVAL